MKQLDYLKDILVRIDIPKECHQLVLDAYKKIDQTYLDYYLCNYDDENVEYVAMLNNWQAVNKKFQINKYLGDLLFTLLMCQKLEEIYERKKYSKELFIHTMKSISYTVIECHLVKGFWGTFVAWWYDDFFRLRRFAFGRIQLEITHFGHTYIDKGQLLKPTMLCLNLHIPRNGEKILPSVIDASLEEGLKFFRPMFNNKPIVVKCETWLFYHKTIEFCDKSSNIYKFSSRFNIFKQIDYDDISDMWRLFDQEVVYDNDSLYAIGTVKDIIDLDKLKADTSLRRKYITHLKNGGKIGEGIGFFIA